MAYTNEQVNKAKKAKSVEELLEMAKAENFPMTEEEAQRIYAALHKEGELSEDELDSVAGGNKKLGRDPMAYSVNADTCPFCNGMFTERTYKYSEMTGEHCGNCIYYKVGYNYNGEKNPYGYCEREFYM